MDTRDPADVVRNLVVNGARRSVGLKEILEHYEGDRVLESPGDLASDPGLGICPDGSVTLAGRLYSGDVAATQAALEMAAVAEKDPRLLGAFRREAERLEALVPRTDPFGVYYGLQHRWMPFEYAREFLGLYGFGLGSERDLPASVPDVGFGVRVLRHVRGEAVTGGGPERFEAMRQAERLDVAFDRWIRGHEDILFLGSLYSRRLAASVPVPMEDSPLDIGEFLTGGLELLPFQRKAVRRLAWEGKGILAFGQGWGRKAVALGLWAWGMKHGLFQRTLLAVPMGDVPAWEAECRRMFVPEIVAGDVAFVRPEACGMGPGRRLADGALETAARALDSRAALVVLPRELAVALRLSETDREAFAEEWGGFVQGRDREAESFARVGRGEDSRAPLFGDAGFDSMLVDRAHLYRGAVSCSEAAGGLMGVRNPPYSRVAANLAAKAHAVRRANGGRGTWALTTAVAEESPVDMINLLALVTDLPDLQAMGLDKADDALRLFGSCRSVKTGRWSPDEDDEEEEGEVLLGYRNLDALRALYRRWVVFEGGELSWGAAGNEAGAGSRAEADAAGGAGGRAKADAGGGAGRRAETGASGKAGVGSEAAGGGKAGVGFEGGVGGKAGVGSEVAGGGKAGIGFEGGIGGKAVVGSEAAGGGRAGVGSEAAGGGKAGVGSEAAGGGKAGVGIEGGGAGKAGVGIEGGGIGKAGVGREGDAGGGAVSGVKDAVKGLKTQARESAVPIGTALGQAETMGPGKVAWDPEPLGPKWAVRVLKAIGSGKAVGEFETTRPGRSADAHEAVRPGRTADTHEAAGHGNVPKATETPGQGRAPETAGPGRTAWIAKATGLGRASEVSRPGKADDASRPGKADGTALGTRWVPGLHGQVGDIAVEPSARTDIAAMSESLIATAIAVRKEAAAKAASSIRPETSVAPTGSFSSETSVAPAGSYSSETSAVPAGFFSSETSAAPAGSDSPETSAEAGVPYSPETSAEAGGPYSPETFAEAGGPYSPETSAVAPAGSYSPEASIGAGGSFGPEPSVGAGGSCSPKATVAAEGSLRKEAANTTGGALRSEAFTAGGRDSEDAGRAGASGDVGGETSFGRETVSPDSTFACASICGCAASVEGCASVPPSQCAYAGDIFRRGKPSRVRALYLPSRGFPAPDAVTIGQKRYALMYSAPGWESWGDDHGWEGWRPDEMPEDDAGEGQREADSEALAERIRRPGEIIELVGLTPWQKGILGKLASAVRDLENGEYARTGPGGMRSAAMMTELVRAMDRVAVDRDTFKGKTTFLFRKASAKDLEAVLAALPDRWHVSRLDELTGKRTAPRLRLRLKARPGRGGLLGLRVPEDMEVHFLRRLAEAGLDEGDLTHPVGRKCARLVEVMRGYLSSGPQAVLAEGRHLQRRVRRIVADALGIPLSKIAAADSGELGGAPLAEALAAYRRGELRVIVCDSKALLYADLGSCSAAVHRLTLPWAPEPFVRPPAPFARRAEPSGRRAEPSVRATEPPAMRSEPFVRRAELSVMPKVSGSAGSNGAEGNIAVGNRAGGNGESWNVAGGNGAGGNGESWNVAGGNGAGENGESWEVAGGNGAKGYGQDGKSEGRNFAGGNGTSNVTGQADGTSNVTGQADGLSNVTDQVDGTSEGVFKACGTSGGVRDGIAVTDAARELDTARAPGALEADGPADGQRARAPEHWYIAEGTQEYYRKAVLDMEDGWMGRLLAGDARYFPNPWAPDSEAYLDMLEGDLEAALSRREARTASIQAWHGERRRDGLVRMLRRMTEMRAEERDAARILDLGPDRTPWARRRETARATARRWAALREIEGLAEARKAELDARASALNGLLLRTYPNGKLYRRISGEKDELREERELMDLRQKAEAEMVARDVRDLAKGRRIDLGEEYRRMKHEREAARLGRARRYVAQARTYLGSMAEAGLLPFDPGLTERLEESCVCADGTLVRAGDRFRRRGPSGVRSLEAVSFDHLLRTVTCRALGWVKDLPNETVPMDSFSAMERLPRPEVPDGM
jgi:hypothetical protein